MGVKLAKVRDLVEFTLILDNLIFLFFLFLHPSLAPFHLKKKKIKEKTKARLFHRDVPEEAVLERRLELVGIG